MKKINSRKKLENDFIKLHLGNTPIRILINNYVRQLRKAVRDLPDEFIDEMINSEKDFKKRFKNK